MRETQGQGAYAGEHVEEREGVSGFNLPPGASGCGWFSHEEAEPDSDQIDCKLCGREFEPKQDELICPKCASAEDDEE
jgi:hypothetical protein